jgi:hypothetical protein
LSTEKSGYYAMTRNPAFCFVAALPLLIVYEVLIMMANKATGQSVRIGPELWLKDALAQIGITGHLTLGGILLVTGLIIFWRERKKGVELKPEYFGFMMLESLVYAVVLGLSISIMVRKLLTMATAPGGSWMHSIALSCGAGLYEELVFRVMLVSAFVWILKPVLKSEYWAYMASAFVTAMLFSLVHYIGPLGDDFALNSFIFRFLFGLAMNALFLTRGFAVAAWTHAIYDIIVMMLN